jgi:lipid II:glycine glycyltransferase (peptidoglycan interpeptide bridge formation enzyme)
LLLYGNKVVSGYAANSKLGRAFRASDFVYWHAIRWASENGYSKFDFGADSPNQTGLRQFKEKWGASEEIVSHYYYLNRINHIPVVDSSKGFWQLTRKLWSLIPDPFFEMFSRWAMRYAD